MFWSGGLSSEARVEICPPPNTRAVLKSVQDRFLNHLSVLFCGVCTQAQPGEKSKHRPSFLPALCPAPVHAQAWRAILPLGDPMASPRGWNTRFGAQNAPSLPRSPTRVQAAASETITLGGSLSGTQGSNPALRQRAPHTVRGFSFEDPGRVLLSRQPTDPAPAPGRHTEGFSREVLPRDT